MTHHVWIDVGYDPDHDVDFQWCANCGTVWTNEEYERDRHIYYVRGSPSPVFGRENQPQCKKLEES